MCINYAVLCTEPSCSTVVEYQPGNCDDVNQGKACVGVSSWHYKHPLKFCNECYNNGKAEACRTQHEEKLRSLGLNENVGAGGK